MSFLHNIHVQAVAQALQHSEILERLVAAVSLHVPALAKAEAECAEAVSIATAAGLPVPAGVTSALAAIASIKAALAPVTVPAKTSDEAAPLPSTNTDSAHNESVEASAGSNPVDAAP